MGALTAAEQKSFSLNASKLIVTARDILETWIFKSFYILDIIHTEFTTKFQFINKQEYFSAI